jgi:hypothetical protein
MLMAEQRHGRYYAQELMMNEGANVREQLQDALDAGEQQEWHLVGVSDVLPERGVILFWDTARPSFASAGPLDSGSRLDLRELCTHELRRTPPYLSLCRLGE